MAEPIKFVQLDCHFDDDKLDFIEAQFGLKGFAIVVKLFQKIYGGLGYYCEWNDRAGALFAKNFCSDAGAALVQEVVKAAIDEKIFDRTMYEKYGILTSHGIQKRFYSVAKRREVVFDKPEYVLFTSSAQKSDDSGDVDISAPNVYNDGQNVCNETTSKVKSSKVKSSKEKEIEAKESNPPSAVLTAEQRNLLFDKYGRTAVEACEQKFERWKASLKVFNGSAFTTVSKWLEEDKPPAGADKECGSPLVEEVNRALIEKYRSLA